MTQIALVIRTADCVPVFIYDAEKKVLGAVHSGWKGTMLNVSGKCIEQMKREFSCDPGGMQVFILPSIGPEMYEVNEDVAQHFPENTRFVNGKIYVDLWGSIENSCVRAGVAAEHIFNTGICSMTNYNEFFSHRYGDAGRNLNFAFISRD
jgi:YfiH family protein